jgi:hypothetical protein
MKTKYEKRIRQVHEAISSYISARDLFNETVNDLRWMKQNKQEISNYNRIRLCNVINKMRTQRALIAKLTSK